MSDDIRIIIGASSQHYPGWLRTQQNDLDLTINSHWEERFAPDCISRILAEHVWEHLSPKEATDAAEICFIYLRPGGFIRIAVPDGLFSDEDYQRTVQPGGPGPADHPAASHKVVYTYRTLPPILAQAGFDVRLLEWWDESGQFYTGPWDEQDGFIYRSARFDHRNRDGRYGFTSLIVDAIKPSKRA